MTGEQRPEISEFEKRADQKRRAEGDKADRAKSNAGWLNTLFEGLGRAHGATEVLETRQGKKAKSNSWTEKGGPATVELWERHLAGEQPGLGVHPLRDDATCGWAAIDIDEYDDFDPKDLAARCAELGLPVVVCRSKSGGAHVFIFLREPAGAERVRALLRRWCTALGYDPDTVEIFPKQDKLESTDDFGNWLNMPYHNGDRATTRYALGPGGGALDNVDDFLALAAERAVTVKQAEAVTLPAAAEEPTGDGDGTPAERLAARCLFAQHCREEAETLREPLWQSLASNLAVVDGGDELFHRLSAPYPGYNKRQAQKKLDAGRKSKRPHTCATIARRGFPCPNMAKDGACGLKGGGKAPVALVRERRAVDGPVLDPRDPHATAVAFVGARYTKDDRRTLVHHGNVFREYVGTHYALVDPAKLRAAVWEYLDAAAAADKNGNLERFKPTRHRVDDVVDALKAAAELQGVPVNAKLPLWLDGPGGHPPARKVVYNTYRTHLGLNKDTPLGRPVRHRGRITSMPKLGGLHHAYVRI